VQGEEIVRAIGSRADEEASPIYKTLVSAITRAQSEVHLTVAYFGPDRPLLKALTGAAQRGVAVKLVLPSYTDSWAIFHLGRSHYTKLLKRRRRDPRAARRRDARQDRGHRRRVVHHRFEQPGLAQLPAQRRDQRRGAGRGVRRADGRDVRGGRGGVRADPARRMARRSLWLRIKERLARLGAYWL
jgi:cardiolipin synthase A/B